MKSKSLLQISVTTSPEAEDAVTALISAILGKPAAAYFNCESGDSTITVYLDSKSHLPAKARRAISTGLKQMKRCGLKIGSGRIVVSRLRRENWAESWKRHFKPIEISRGRARHSVPAATMARRGLRSLPKSLLIKPSWSKRKARQGQEVIVLDPGLSFGTGHHPTTAFCLREMVRTACEETRPTKTKSFLDLGTGSGILAIAAAKLGYSPIIALDFDANAVAVSRSNARANHVFRKIKIVYGDVTRLPVCPRRPRHGYDLVCANLISDLLIAERRRIAAQLKAGGTLVLAGILKSEFGRVRAAYEHLGLKLASCRSEKEWCSGIFRPDA